MKKRRLRIWGSGGPAPGINGVISAAIISGIGFRDGFTWLAAGKHPLAILS